MSEILISKDKSLLDVYFIHRFLTKSYWAKGRSREKVEQTIANSICYGMFLNESQIGFARVLSDFCVFGYLMDVFIDEKQQGKGYGKMLMQSVLEDEQFAHLERWMLATMDAQGFYKELGFENLKNPERIMGLAKIKNNVHL